MKTFYMGAMVLGLSLGTWAMAAGPSTQPAQSKPEETAPTKRDTPLPIEGKADPKAPGYIVLFEDNVNAKAEVARLEKLYGFKAKFTYDNPGFKGFAAAISKEAIEKMRWELNIKLIEHDGTVGVN